MTRNDPSIDDDLFMFEESDLQERALLSAASLTSIAGLVGYAAVRLPAFSPDVSIPHLLALSVLAFGVGTGAFALLLNHYITLVFSKRRMAKVAAVYATVLAILVPLVDAGAFHPRLAMVFICLLAGGGVVHAVFFQQGVTPARNQQA